MIEYFQIVATTFSSWAWGPWLLVVLLGGGFYFLLYTRFAPFRHLPHAWQLLRGRYDDPNDPGQISHFQALSSALAGTIGMGNIAGVALAITVGGPGTIFWMWMTAILGIATKFFTCSLAVMYRGRDSAGELQGGPMYVIREALGPRWRFLAYWFAFFGLIGALPALQANQLVQILRDVVYIDQGLLDADADPFAFNLATGLTIAVLSSLVIFGGLKRIAAVASRMVPSMSALYLGATALALILNIDQLPGVIALIVTDAFTGEAVGGGALLTVILYGVQRGAYSNEAGIGTESMAHGAAKTREPIREGLVAMLGPAGVVVVFICAVSFAMTTVFTYSFYGSQCASFLFGVGAQFYYRWVYVSFIVIASLVSLRAAISIIDGAFAMMAIPTMISALLLAPKVKAAADVYFGALDRPPR